MQRQRRQVPRTPTPSQGGTWKSNNESVQGLQQQQQFQQLQSASPQPQRMQRAVPLQQQQTPRAVTPQQQQTPRAVPLQQAGPQRAVPLQQAVPQRAVPPQQAGPQRAAPQQQQIPQAVPTQQPQTPSAATQQPQVQLATPQQEVQLAEQQQPSAAVAQNQANDKSLTGMMGQMNVDDKIVDENGKPKFKKIFTHRKKSSLRSKEKKIRRNRLLRKAILPKNALMALNELKGIAINEVTVNANTSGGFIAVLTVNNKQYEGQGTSKTAAKNKACEKALRDYVIEKMRQKPRTTSKSLSGSTEAMDTTDNDETNDAGEDVPMINLVSFAIFKLFSEWEKAGFDIPELHPAANTANAAAASANGAGEVQAPKEPKKPANRTELPPNWETMHPTSLLCMMRPGLTYTDKGAIGDPPNVFQRQSVIIDNQEFIGAGRSKKIARRNVAAAVCNMFFATAFIKQEVDP